MNTNIYKRLAETESITAFQKSQLLETLQAAYKSACEMKDKKLAEEAARKIRNKLLDETDKQMSLDRLELKVSSITELLLTLSKVLNGEWAEYRQALRDLPEQSGFPFDIKFPTPPSENA